MTGYSRSALIAAVLIATLPAAAVAQSKPPDLFQATIEQLMSLEITSAGRRQQRKEDVAAAVYVITREDIRRSGLTLVPEILRLAPGVQVARVNANKWAISVRGFNSIYSNKLLILLDGRSLFNRAFAGVLWDGLDLDIDEIERIEIVRGPGGAMWGSNAINGVINIITRSAHASKGLSASLSAGTFEESRGTLRYGGSLGRAGYRVYGQWSGYGEGGNALGDPAGDQWKSLTGGYRFDWANRTDTLMSQGSYTAGKNHPLFFVMDNAAPGGFSSTGVTTTEAFSVLGRWTRTAGNGAVFQAQGYMSYASRNEPMMHVVERASDLDIQYERELPRQTLVIGGGFREIDLTTVATPTLQLAPEHTRIFNAFAEDEVALARRLKLTLGARLEYEGAHGWEMSPSGRLIWEASPRQRIWAALSHAARKPTAVDQSLRINLTSMPGPGLPILIGLVGNPDYAVEELTQAEVGYRLRVGSKASFDLAAFKGRYDNLPTLEPQAPVFEASPGPPHLFVAQRFANLMAATTKGLELSAHWSPLPTWQLEASYTALRLTPIVDAASRDSLAPLFDGNAPRQQWQLHSTTQIGARTQVQAAFYRVGALRQLEVPAYTRLDTYVEVNLGRGLAAILSGRNLLNTSHIEFSSARAIAGSSVPRSARVQLRWQFR
jgi:iron complex outermembrane receptor protein